MENEEGIKTKSQGFKLSIKPSLMRQVEFLMKHYDKDSVQDLFKTLVDIEHQKIKTKMMTYKIGPSALQERKAQEAETLAKIKAMSGDELLAFILETGYVKDHEEDGDFVSYSIGNETDGKPFALMCNKSKSLGGPIFYKYSVHDTLEQIINSLQKEKLI